jgi:hypothetical protein
MHSHIGSSRGQISPAVIFAGLFAGLVIVAAIAFAPVDTGGSRATPPPVPAHETAGLDAPTPGDVAEPRAGLDLDALLTGSRLLSDKGREAVADSRDDIATILERVGMSGGDIDDQLRLANRIVVSGTFPLGPAPPADPAAPGAGVQPAAMALAGPMVSFSLMTDAATRDEYIAMWTAGQAKAAETMGAQGFGAPAPATELRNFTHNGLPGVAMLIVTTPQGRDFDAEAELESAVARLLAGGPQASHLADSLRLREAVADPDSAGFFGYVGFGRAYTEMIDGILATAPSPPGGEDGMAAMRELMPSGIGGIGVRIGADGIRIVQEVDNYVVHDLGILGPRRDAILTHLPAESALVMSARLLPQGLGAVLDTLQAELPATWRMLNDAEDGAQSLADLRRAGNAIAGDVGVAMWADEGSMQRSVIAVTITDREAVEGLIAGQSSLGRSLDLDDNGGEPVEVDGASLFAHDDHTIVLTDDVLLVFPGSPGRIDGRPAFDAYRSALRRGRMSRDAMPGAFDFCDADGHVHLALNIARLLRLGGEPMREVASMYREDVWLGMSATVTDAGIDTRIGFGMADLFSLVGTMLPMLGGMQSMPGGPPPPFEFEEPPPPPTQDATKWAEARGTAERVHLMMRSH